MSSASQEEPYDVLDGFFGEFDHLARGFEAPRKKTAGQKLGAAAGILIGIGVVIVCLGTLAWIAALVFNQLLAQVG
jgi:hypothetical protein